MSDATEADATAGEVVPVAVAPISPRLWQHAGASLTGLACLVAGGGGIAGYLGRHWWVFDMASHFRVQLSLVLLAGLAVFALQRRRHAGIAVAGLLVATAAPLGPYLLLQRSPEVATKLRIATLNVHTSNRDHASIIDWVLAERPDVVGFQEVDDTWLAALEAGLGDEYPYRRAHPRGDNFGMAVFSRLPILDDEVLYFDGVSVPTMVVRLERLTVVCAHPTPPFLSQESHTRRDHALAAIGDHAATLDGPVVLLGDLNTSPWSWSFADLCRRSGLRDAGRNAGINATWPTGNVLLSTPLDHILVSPDITVSTYRATATVGSDHRPVICTIGAP